MKFYIAVYYTILPNGLFCKEKSDAIPHGRTDLGDFSEKGPYVHGMCKGGKRDTRKGVPAALKFVPVLFRGKTVVFPEDPVEIADIFVAHGQGDVADPLGGVLQQPGRLS